MQTDATNARRMTDEPNEIKDNDFDEPLPERPATCNMDEGCESCQ